MVFLAFVDGGFTAAIVVSLLLAATSVILSELLRPKPKFENARPASLGDFTFPTAIEGRPVPIVWGKVKLQGPNVVWYGNLRQEALKKSIKTGLFSSKSIVTGFKYFVGIQMGLCRGTIDALKRIWIGDVVVFDGSATSLVNINKPDLFGGDDLGGGGVVGDLRVHLGGELQAVNAYLTAFQSPQPAYRGTAYVVWEGGHIGNSTSIKPWYFEVERFPNGLGATNPIVNLEDANPACVLFELFTDPDWGFGLLSSDIDLVNWRAAAATLFTEGNGFAGVLDRQREAIDLLREIERQVDGVVFLDPESGKLKLALARGGYDIDLVPQLNDGNVIDVQDFTRGTWAETFNQVRVQFSDRKKGYMESYAQAHDLANLRIQNGQLVTADLHLPFVKNRDVANQVASRSLRSLSTPLVKANVVVDRTFYALKPGDVVAWTDPNYGFVKLPMRVTRVDLGAYLDGKIQLGLIQDIFNFQAAFFGAPQDTLWVTPNTNVDPFPSANQRAMEAPFALIRRDVDLPETLDRIFAAGRRVTGGEASFRIWERNASGSPSGSFQEAGEVFGFALIGQNRNALTAGNANPMTVAINGTPDTLSALQAAFTPTPSAGDIGQNLVNLILVDDEFMAVTTVVNQGTHLDLQVTYRGMLDTAPAVHAVNANVFLVFAGSGLSADTVPPTNNVDVKLRPRSRTDEVTENEATTIAFQMQNRARRPYPPVQMKVNTVLYPTSADFDTLKSGGTTLDDRGLDVSYTRRDYRTLDEVQGITTDAASISGDFPTANQTKYKAKIIKDPAGTPVTLFETAFNTGEASIFLSRTKILRFNAGAKPANVRVELTARHTFDLVVYDALQLLRFDFALGASTLDNDTNMGVLTQNAIGAVYTAPTTGTYTFNLGVALSSGNVEARINGGAFSTVIAAGNTTGTLAGVVASDTIEVRHTQSGGGAGGETFLEVDAPSSSVDAYAILLK